MSSHPAAIACGALGGGIERVAGDAPVHRLELRRRQAACRLPHRAGEAADTAAIDAALAATDATQFADRPILSLSGGERARVLLARVLAGEPAWILADEPLASLDPAHRFALLDLLRTQAGRGVGVGVVLHDLALAGTYADDAILLDGGHVVAHGHALDVLSPSRIAQVFRVRARRSGDALVIEGPL